MSNALSRAHAAVEGEDWSSASHWFEMRLAEQPDDLESRAWLGQCLCSLGRRASGIELLREAGRGYVEAARSSGQTAVLLELSAELQHWRDPEGAVPLLQAAVSINAGDPHAYHLLGLALAQLNRIDEALAAVTEAARLAPQTADLQLLRCSLLADSGQYALAGSGLETLLAQRLEPRTAFRAHKELAKVLDRLGSHDRVFPHLHKASGLAASVTEFAEFDPRVVPAMIRSNRFGYNSALMGRWQNAAFADRAPVFVVGFLRSGTTLTQEVLAAHPGVFVADEVNLVSQTIAELHRRVPGAHPTATKLQRLDAEGIAALRQFYWTAVSNHFGDQVGTRLFVDKYTMNTVEAGFINAVFPDARLIFVRRDPRDVCLSCFLQLMVPSLTTVHLLHWNDIGRLYAEVMGWWFHIRGQLTVAVHEFRYEEAVTDFEAVFRRVFEFLEVPWNPRVAEFHRNVSGKFIASPSRNQVAQPLYASSVGRWRRYSREFGPIRSSLGPFIRAMGYEPFEPS